MKKLFISSFAAILLVVYIFGVLQDKSVATESKSLSKYVDSEGNITKPTEFREKWTYLGSWVHPENSENGFHNVYTEPGVAEQYKNNGGKFPDGAIIVKEILSSSSQNMTTGKDVQFAKDPVQWFVMVKDNKNRFPDNPRWGEGWGWALYKADAPSKDVSTDYKKDCLGCHIPAKSTDYIYIDGYPVLDTK